MASGKNNSTQSSALGIAEAQFPEQAGTVRQLFQMNETFRSMCEDLAAAAEALADVDRLPHSIRDARRQEYTNLVDALVTEIGDALAQSKVVILRRWGEPKPKPH